MWLTGPVAPWHVGSSQTRARTRVPCIGRRTLNHCATREAPLKFLYSKITSFASSSFLYFFAKYFLMVSCSFLMFSMLFYFLKQIYFVLYIYDFQCLKPLVIYFCLLIVSCFLVSFVIFDFLADIY